jgi:radical SAM protein (TIGR01212 family)
LGDKVLINRYKSINTLLRERFGERVYKVTLDIGSGCPNRDGTYGRDGCNFCHPEALRPNTSRDLRTTPEPLRAQIEKGIEYVRRRHGSRRVISYLQNGSNTYAAADKLRPLLREAVAHPSVAGLAVSTRPDCIEQPHADLMAELAEGTMVWVELGLQSSHEETLIRIGRGHGVACFEQAHAMLSDAGVPVCAHVILGLPGETHGMMMDTARFLNETGVWGVKIHNLHVLKDTRLEGEFRRGEVHIPSLEEYAGWVVDFLEELSPETVIHRLGSHSHRRLTVAPEWSINKLATLNAVHDELERRGTWQGKRPTAGR